MNRWPETQVVKPMHALSAGASADPVVAYVRTLIERGAVGPGDRLPPERELATQLGVSRPTLRAGLKALAAMGVVRSRRGSGTFIPVGPPALSSMPLGFMSSLYGVTREQLFEARRILEGEVAALAARRATRPQLAILAEVVEALFASLDDPAAFLVHDIHFHRLVGEAAGNPALASLVGMVVGLFYERRRANAARASARSLEDAARMHRRIYRAIRRGDADAARHAMHEHLTRANAFQAAEAVPARPRLARRPS